jgi:hypothetical protein
VLADDISPQFGFAGVLLALNATTFALTLPVV